MYLMLMHLDIITPDRAVYDGDCSSITLPTADGEITVLPRHVPLVTTIVPGTMTVRAPNREELYAVSRGVIEIDGKSVRVLTDIADRADSLEEAEIEKAKQEAELIMSEKRSDAESFAEATAVLDRELARLRTVRRHRARRVPGVTPPTDQ